MYSSDCFSFSKFFRLQIFVSQRHCPVLQQIVSGTIMPSVNVSRHKGARIVWPAPRVFHQSALLYSSLPSPTLRQSIEEWRSWISPIIEQLSRSSADNPSENPLDSETFAIHVECQLQVVEARDNFLCWFIIKGIIQHWLLFSVYINVWFFYKILVKYSSVMKLKHLER